MPAQPENSFAAGPPIDIERPAAYPAGRITLRTLILIRWLAIAGQGLAILFVHYGLEMPVKLVPALAIVGVSALVNLFLMMRYPAGRPLGDRPASIQLAYDILQLAALLYVTGGIANPFSILMLAPLTISATILSRRATLGLLGLALVLSLGLVFWHSPLPWPGTGPDIPPLYIWGVWSALAISMSFLVYYANRVAEEARQRADALAATEAALAHEHRLAAVGGLAAAAAHELGTPLGTILVTARELKDRSAGLDKDLAEDIDLLVAQAERSRAILQRLSRPSDVPQADAPVPLEALIHQALDALQADDIRLDLQSKGEGAAPAVPDRAEIIYGLRNFLENAFDFARGHVRIVTNWADDRISVIIADDGPGYDPAIMPYLGEPYISKRQGENAHGLGLGIFIAKTLLERTGAEIRFGRSDLGGAEVRIVWQRAPGMG